MAKGRTFEYTITSTQTTDYTMESHQSIVFQMHGTKYDRWLQNLLHGGIYNEKTIKW